MHIFKTCFFLAFTDNALRKIGPMRLFILANNIVHDNLNLLVHDWHIGAKVRSYRGVKRGQGHLGNIYAIVLAQDVAVHVQLQTIFRAIAVRQVLDRRAAHKRLIYINTLTKLHRFFLNILPAHFPVIFEHAVHEVFGPLPVHEHE